MPDAITALDQRLTAAHIRAAIRARFHPNSHAVLEEVHDTTGSRSRSCDVLVMSLWRSQGLTLTGIEIKMGRSDWLRERARPEKAEGVGRYCDRWYIAAPSTAIVPLHELPPTWGLYVLTSAGALRCARQGKPLAPMEWDRAFIAAMLRRALQAGLREEERRAIEDRAAETARELNRRAIERLRIDIREVEERIARFEQASGVKLDGWQGPERIGDAVRAVLAGQHLNVRERLEHSRGLVTTLLTTLQAHIDEAIAQEAQR